MKEAQVTSGLTISLDGFAAGHNQSFEKPFGDHFDASLLDRWMFSEPEKHKHKKEIEGILDADAFIMGSNMFGPKDRREKTTWKGWWGDNPPYHAPVFVLSHFARPSIKMQGGTVFHFITDGIDSALEKAKEAAGSQHVKIMGGASTVNQYLAAGLIDELWLHIVPVTVGTGMRLFEGVPNIKLEAIEQSGSSVVTHIKYKVLK
ncbi:dihydrofolate reductase family protein [Echinicola marina]|uniref:dihydrofolate reductase family protein n=1 Tax=Echinicola marina TaxID=2859768 RepID=UPI001CF6D918|nr:dihydrofolate reductase family protein [Echinicola marina]UCS92726.1 dihydrofolate reductase family protein [Echinicola marina]